MTFLHGYFENFDAKEQLQRARGSRKLVLFIVFVALFLDNMLLTVVGKFNCSEPNSVIAILTGHIRYVVFNIMSFAGKSLVKISFGPLQSYFWAKNILTMPDFEWSNELKTEK